MSIAVAIVTHRNASTIEACLASVLASPLVTYVRVVDSASDDETVNNFSRFASRDPRVHFIASEENLGFGRGINLAVEDLPREFDGTLLVLNPDCEIEPSQVDALSRLDGTALIGTALVDEDGVLDGNARRNDLLFWPTIQRVFGQSSYQFLIPSDGSSLQEVPAISGAVMWMPVAVFKALGGFDEGYRLHAEDLDFCVRARALGIKIYCANDVAVKHLRSVSSKKRPFFVEWNKHLGLMRYFRKFEAVHLNFIQRLVVLGGIWARFPVSLARAVLRMR